MPISTLDSSTTTQTPKRFDDPMLSNRAFAIISIVTILLAMILLLAPKAGATTYTWDGNAPGGTGNSKWSTVGNWDANGIPVSNLTTADVVFAGTLKLGPSMDATYSIHSLSFSGASAFTLSSAGTETLTIGTGGITNNNTSVTGQTISSALILGAAQSWTANSGPLIVSNSSSVTNGGFLLTISGASNTSIAAVISGTGGLTKSGNGTLTLSGGNNYTGLTDVQAGTLAYGANNIIVDTASIKVSGGTFDIKNFSDTVAGVQLTSGNINGTTGVLTSTSTFDLQSGSVGAILGGSVGLNKTTSGTVTLNNANTYTGLTNITAGTLAEGASNAIGTGAVTVNGATAVFNLGANHTDSVGIVTVDGGASITGTGTSTLTSTGSFEMKSGSVSAILAGSGIALNKTTSGTVTLSGLNTYTGLTNVTAGTLAYGADNVIGTGAVTVNGATAVLDLGASHTDSVGTVTLDGGASITGTGTSTLTSTGSFEMKNGSVSAILAGAGIALNKTTGGTVTLTGNNTFSGTTTISGGTLNANATGGGKALGGTTNIIVNAGGTLLTTSAQQFNGGTPPTMTLAGGTFNTNGTSQTLGAMTLTDNSIIDLANGASILAFANSSSQAWTAGKTISIYNWTGDKDNGGGTDQLFFGIDTNGLTAGQLAQFQFYSDAGLTAYSAGGVILANGEVVAVPEPATWFGALLTVGVVVYTQRRRFARLLRRGDRVKGWRLTRQAGSWEPGNRIRYGYGESRKAVRLTPRRAS